MYKLNTSGITRLADNASIPADPANRDYAEYLEWAKTNTAAPQFTPAEITANAKAATNAAAKAALVEIDLTSIRAMREFMLAKFSTDPLMPAQLKVAGDAATVERGKIK